MDGLQQPPTATSYQPIAPYQVSPLRRDVAVMKNGVVREAWEPIFESCARNGVAGLTEWRREAARLSRERWLAYRPGGEEEANWKLDPIPWVVPEEEWQAIEAGMEQRVRLYSALLADLYGKQHLLKSGLVPPTLLLSQPRYLRPCQDLGPGPHRPGLGMVSFDLASDRGGKVFAVDGHFDSPFGLGLALETRTVINKTLANLFRRCRTRRIGHFFKDWFQHLLRLAPKGVEDPRIVILDHDREGEHSEMSFLANYCGIVRVHPSDLTVRGAKVWLKTLDGLKPVHVIWRAQEGLNLDPLEVRNWTRFGVSGLFSAMREGNVAVVSHPGCGALRTAGLYPFLPSLSYELLGEEMLLPPVATWWCGSEVSLRTVLERLPTMVIKEVAPTGTFATAYGQRLSSSGLAELRARIKADPARYVAQEEIAISTIPSSTDEGLVPRGAVMRCFAYADGNGGAKVMPGGLGRVSAETGVIVSTRKAGIARDVWVQSREQEAAVSIAQVVASTQQAPKQVVPSRTAENLFWAGRNAERAESIAHVIERLLRGREQGFAYGESVEAQHEAILLRTLFATFKLKQPKGTKADPHRASLALILGEKPSAVSLSSTLESLRANSMATREVWSPASLLALDTATSAWPAMEREARSLSQNEAALQKLQLGLSAFLGCNLDSMTRDSNWILLDAGRRVERCFFQVGILRHAFSARAPGALDTLINESLLYVSDSLRTYQQKFLAVPSTSPTLQLLLGEAGYPRSLTFQLDRLDTLLPELPKPLRDRHPHDRIASMKEDLRGFLLQLESTPSEELGHHSFVLEYLDQCAEQISQLGNQITTAYFSHAERQALPK